MCQKAFCRETESTGPGNGLSDVEIIELDSDNNVFVDSFLAPDSSIFVDDGADFGDNFQASAKEIMSVSLVNDGFLFNMFITHKLLISPQRYFACTPDTLFHYKTLNLLQFELIVFVLFIFSATVLRFVLRHNE